MKPLTEREVIVLARQCGMRVCSTEEHHGCPYGDESMVDCAERLEKDYEEAIERALELMDEVRAGQCAAADAPDFTEQDDKTPGMTQARGWLMRRFMRSERDG